MTTTQATFIPRVLRSDAGSVAVEVGPGAPGFFDLYQLVVLGPDGVKFLQASNLPTAPGAMLTRVFLGRAPDVLRWRELTLAAADRNSGA